MDLCRICAQISNDSQQIFEIVHNGVILAEMLQYCLKRQITKENGLPTSICLNCNKNLVFTYDFLKLCESSEKILFEKLAINNTTEDVFQQNLPVEIKIEDQISDVEDNSEYACDETYAFELETDENEYFDESIDMIEKSALLQPKESGPNSNAEEVTRQQKIKRNVEKREFECFECKKKFDKMLKLKKHMNDHRPLECKLCKSRFMRFKVWYRHRLRHNTNVYDCEYCEEEFSKKPILKKHIQEAHKHKMDAYKCNQCTKKFPLRILLFSHQEWHRDSIRSSKSKYLPKHLEFFKNYFNCFILI